MTRSWAAGASKAEACVREESPAARADAGCRAQSVTGPSLEAPSCAHSYDATYSVHSSPKD